MFRLRQQVTTLLCLISCSAYCQGWLPVGARSMSLANATVAVHDNWSYHHNPGALAHVRKLSLGSSYESRFLLPELQTQALVLAIPLKVGTLSTGLQSFGHKNYRTNRIGIGYSLLLSETFSAGVQINYHRVRILNYGASQLMTAEAGVLAKINEKLFFGFSIVNLNRAKLTEQAGNWLSTHLRLGLSYQINPEVLLLFESTKEVLSAIRFKTAVEYEFIPQFRFRTGAASAPFEIAFGFGYNTRYQLQINMGSAYQQIIGWSPHIGLNYAIPNKP